MKDFSLRFFFFCGVASCVSLPSLAMVPDLKDLAARSLVQKWSQPNVTPKDVLAEFSSENFTEDLIAPVLRAFPRQTCIQLYVENKNQQFLTPYLRKVFGDIQVSITKSQEENKWRASHFNDMLHSGSFQDMTEGPFPWLCFSGEVLSKLEASEIQTLKDSPVENLTLKKPSLDVVNTLFLEASPDPEKPFFQNLRQLTVYEGNGDNEGDHIAQAMALSQSLPCLTSLSLFRIGVSEGGAKTIADSSTLRHLNRLLLDSNNIGNEGAIALMRSKGLQNLAKLHLQRNNIDEVGIETIVKGEILPLLTHLYLVGNPIFAEELELIEKAFPDLKLFF
jgi:hypothetical protein